MLSTIHISNSSSLIHNNNIQRYTLHMKVGLNSQQHTFTFQSSCYSSICTRESSILLQSCKPTFSFTLNICCMDCKQNTFSYEDYGNFLTKANLLLTDHANTVDVSENATEERLHGSHLYVQ